MPNTNTPYRCAQVFSSLAILLTVAIAGADTQKLVIKQKEVLKHTSHTIEQIANLVNVPVEFVIEIQSRLQ